MIRSAWFWPILILLSAVGALAAALGEVAPPLRAALTLWFLLFCPGMAYVRLLRLNEPFITWTLAFALSVSLSTLLGMSMMMLDAWYPQAGLVVLVGISAAGAVLQIAVQAQSHSNKLGSETGETVSLSKGGAQ